MSNLILKMWLWNPILSPTKVLWKNAILPFGLHGYFHFKTTKFDSTDITFKSSTVELPVSNICKANYYDTQDISREIFIWDMGFGC